jgi:adenosylcobinamide-phosphate synthase
MSILLLLALALILDIAFGEPSDAFHPVAWMGKVISFLERRGLSRPTSSHFAYGVMITIAIVALFAVPAYFLLSYLKGVSLVAYVIVGALVLKLTFSFRGLRRTALKIKNLLQNDKLDKARFELRALVSRDTSTLSQPQLVSATVESVAESTCDSFVAPLFFFLIFGVPGAIAYRVVSTLDSRIGYHGRYEYLGKFASRVDDVLNYIPARITALLLVAAAFFSRRNGKRAWRVALSNHSKTESPNAGWPMAAAAGALNVQLEKANHYKLGNGGAALTPKTIDKSLILMRLAAVFWVLICFASRGGYFVYTT